MGNMTRLCPHHQRPLVGAKSYLKIQLLRVQEILEEKHPEIPHGSANMSFESQEVKTLQRQSKRGNSPSLFGDD